MSEDVVRPLTESARLAAANSSRQAARLIEQGAVWRGTVRRQETMDDLVSDLTAGCAALVFEGLGIALTFETKSQTGRPVQEATIEKAVKGARDAFCETLRVNTSLVRRRLRTPKLKLTEQSAGRESNTRIALLYIEGIAKPSLVEAVRARIAAMDLDAVLSAGDLEPYVTDHPRSPLPQTAHTERPDKLAAALLQGRVGLIVDGLPVGFLLPGTLGALMRALGCAVPQMDFSRLGGISKYDALLILARRLLPVRQKPLPTWVFATAAFAIAAILSPTAFGLAVWSEKIVPIAGAGIAVSVPLFTNMNNRPAE